MPAEYKNDPNPILLDSTKINEHIDLLLYNIFCSRRRFVTGDVLLRRRFVEETFCYKDVLLGDVLSRRRFVYASILLSVKICKVLGLAAPRLSFHLRS